MKATSNRYHLIVGILFLADISLTIFDYLFCGNIRSSILGGVLVNGSKSLFYQSFFLLQIIFFLGLISVRFPERLEKFFAFLKPGIKESVRNKGVLAERQFNRLMNVILTLASMKFLWLSITHEVQYGIRASEHIFLLDGLFSLLLYLNFRQKFVNRYSLQSLLTLVIIVFGSYLYFNPASHRVAKVVLATELTIGFPCLCILKWFRKYIEAPLLTKSS
jgi:hypothetical protein